MNALDPIRHAYGEAEGTPPLPGEPGHAEYRLLRATRDVLDALPRERPDAAVFGAIEEAAKSRVLGPVQAAYGEAEAPAAGDPRYAEYALLASTRQVLDRIPKARPDTSVRDAVARAAREATLGPLHHAYGEAEGAVPAPGTPAFAEYALLRTTRAALDTLPRPRPDASALDAVKAMAKARALRPTLAAYGEAEAPAAGDPQHTEYALLRSTREVLNRAPKARPDAAVLAAISAAAASAAQATPVPAAAPVRPARPRPAEPAGPRPARDRPARARILPFGRIPAWIGTAAVLVLVATAGLWVLNERSPRAPASGEVADAQAAAPPEAQSPAAQAVPAPSATGQDLVAQAAPSPSPSAGTREAEPRPSVAAGRLRDTAPPPAPPAPAAMAPQQESARVASARAAEAADDASAAGRLADEALVHVGAWEAGEDVRLLSLRLQQIAETTEGLSWDEPPVPFGVTNALGGARLEGVQSVGSGPARVEVRMRTTPSDRSNGQQPRR